MKKQLWILFLLCVVIACFLTACSGEENYNGTKIVFELEGGTYKNSQKAVVYYVDFSQGQSRVVKDLPLLKGLNTDLASGEKASTEEAKLTLANYEVEGWYKVKNETDGNVTYSERFNVATDDVPEEGITLYARWVKKVKYYYSVYYLDETTSQKVVLGTSSVNAGQKFNQDTYRNTRKGYTLLNYYDADGNLWDSSFVHPGGEVDTTVEVRCDFIQGDFKLVSTAKDLSRYWGTYNIYLLNDIDMSKQSTLTSKKLNNLKIYGNGHTISNMTVKFGQGVGTGGLIKSDLVNDLNDSGSKSFYVGLFSEMTNCEVKDITFSNLTYNIDVKIPGTDYYKLYVSPMCAKVATNSTLNGVLMEVSYKFGSGVEQTKLECTDGLCYSLTDSTVTDCNANVTKTFAAE